MTDPEAGIAGSLRHQATSGEGDPALAALFADEALHARAAQAARLARERRDANEAEESRRKTAERRRKRKADQHASDAFDPRLRFGMGNATHRQRWETRGPALSWVSRCAPAACGEGVTLPYGKPLPLEAAVSRSSCWSTWAAGPRARLLVHARAHVRTHARARTSSVVLRYTVLDTGRIYIASVPYNCENTSHLQFLSDTEIPIYAQNLLHNTK